MDPMGLGILYTPQDQQLEPENDGVEDDFPFQ